MKVSYPLSLKVSVWLLLNLLLLAAAAIGFFVVQGGLGWNALVAGPAGEHAQSVANVIAGEAAAATRENRDAVLKRFGAAHGVQYFLLRPDDSAALPELPAELRGRFEFWPPRGPGEFGGRFGGRGFGGDRNDPRRREAFDPNRPSPPDGMRREPPDEKAGPTAEGPRREGSPDSGRREIFGGERGRFVLHAGSPAAYWVGLRVPFVSAERGRPLPTMLVARIGSLWGLLRFLNLQSWLLAATGVLALSVLFWWPLMRGITRSLGQLTAATEQIADGHFETRVPAARRDEIGRLGESVNRMAARLDAHMTGQRKFLGDVAHELCSPLARLQMATGILGERAPADLRDTVGDVREEVQQMSALVNELLLFTKAGMQPREVVLQELALATLVAQVLAREAAEDRVTVNLPPDLRVRADADLLARAIGNLVRNALRYAGDSGGITVSARLEGNRAVIAVEDDGPGVPADALDRLGEPFYRPEAARTRELGGVGLGLSIVRGSVAACGGDVRFANREPHGFRAEIRLAAA
jgi:two-component system sensor histidine kinase CpxA